MGITRLKRIRSVVYSVTHLRTILETDVFMRPDPDLFTSLTCITRLP